MNRHTTFAECVAAFRQWAEANDYEPDNIDLKKAWIDAITWREELAQRDEGEGS